MRSQYAVDDRDGIVAGEATERKGGSPVEDVVGSTGPFDVARIDGLRGEVWTVGMKSPEEIRVVRGRSENVRGKAPVEVREVSGDATLELGPALGEPGGHRVSVGGSGQWRGRPIEPV